MYDNIGSKIKSLAKVIFCIGVILCLLGGIALIGTLPDLWFIGLLVMIIGPITSWISTWLLYGFGELIDKACDIERNTRGLVPKQQTPSNHEKRTVSVKATPKSQPPVNLDDANFSETICPICRRELAFPYGTSQAECPYCGSFIQLQ